MVANWVRKRNICSTVCVMGGKVRVTAVLLCGNFVVQARPARMGGKSRVTQAWAAREVKLV
jgi:hypothetical protein